MKYHKILGTQELPAHFSTIIAQGMTPQYLVAHTIFTLILKMITIRDAFAAYQPPPPGLTGL
jgi:hypothetical protein